MIFIVLLPQAWYNKRMTTYYAQYTPIFKALSDETRLKIVQMLTCERMHANSILECFSLTQPSLSYHMKILTEAGLVRAERQGGFTIYSVNANRLLFAMQLMQELLSGTEVSPAEEETEESGENHDWMPPLELP